MHLTIASSLLVLIQGIQAQTIKEYPPAPFTEQGIKGPDTIFTQKIGGLNYTVVSPWISSLNAIAYGGWRAFDGKQNSEAHGYAHYNSATGVPSCGGLTDKKSCEHTILFQTPKNITLTQVTLKYPSASFATAFQIFGCPPTLDAFPTAKCEVLLNAEHVKDYLLDVLTGSVSKSFNLTVLKPYNTYILKVNQLNVVPGTPKKIEHSLRTWQLFGFDEPEIANSIKEYPPAPFTKQGIKRADTVFTQKFNGQNYTVVSPWINSLDATTWGGWHAFDGQSNTRAEGYAHYNSATGIPSCGGLDGLKSCEHTILFQAPTKIRLDWIRLMYPRESFATAFQVFWCPRTLNAFPTDKCEEILSWDQGPYCELNEDSAYPGGYEQSEDSVYKIFYPYAYTPYDTFILKVNKLNTLPGTPVTRPHSLKSWRLFGNDVVKAP